MQVNGKNKFCKNYIFKYEVRGQSTTMVMTSVLGHVKVLDFGPGYSDWQRVPVEELFSAPVIQDIPSKMQDVADNLRIEARKSEILIIWTDCDREGEYIGAEIAQICLSANSRLDIYRARYSVLNFTELSRSIRNLPRLDMRQVAAAELRSELDLRGGAAFTRLQTLCFRERQSELRDKIISYGSCQFPTLGFVVEQYLKIMNFVPEPFWSIQLELSQNGRITKFVWKRNRLFSRLMCLILYERCVEQGRALITKVESKPTSKWYHVVYLILTTRRPIPLRTVELQKFGSRYLKLSSDRVMEIAEKLYNQGYISYPRTETDMFENAFDLNSLIAKQQNHSTWGSYASNLLNGRFKFPRKGKNNDKAHPPIHPTKDGSGLVGAEAKVYEFVARRFLACCSDDAHGLETIVLARMGDEEFRARGIK
jgi:DNA topoisomerase-3